MGKLEVIQLEGEKMMKFLFCQKQFFEKFQCWIFEILKEIGEIIKIHQRGKVILKKTKWQKRIHIYSHLRLETSQMEKQT